MGNPVDLQYKLSGFLCLSTLQVQLLHWKFLLVILTLYWFFFLLHLNKPQMKTYWEWTEWGKEGFRPLLLSDLVPLCMITGLLWIINNFPKTSFIFWLGLLVWYAKLYIFFYFTRQLKWAYRPVWTFYNKWITNNYLGIMFEHSVAIYGVGLHVWMHTHSIRFRVDNLNLNY